MAAFNIPPYLERYHEDMAADVQFLTFSEGLSRDIWRYVVNRHGDTWAHARVWQSLYFSLACWMSLAQVSPLAPVCKPPCKHPAQPPCTTTSTMSLAHRRSSTPTGGPPAEKRRRRRAEKAPQQHGSSRLSLSL